MACVCYLLFHCLIPTFYLERNLREINKFDCRPFPNANGQIYWNALIHLKITANHTILTALFLINSLVKILLNQTK